MSEPIQISEPKVKLLMPPTPSGKRYKAEVCNITHNGIDVGTLERDLGNEGGIVYNTYQHSIGAFNTDEEALEKLEWEFGGLISKDRDYYFRRDISIFKLDECEPHGSNFPLYITPLQELLKENIDEGYMSYYAQHSWVSIQKRKIFGFDLYGDNSYKDWCLAYYLGTPSTPVNFVLDWSNRSVNLEYCEDSIPVLDAFSQLDTLYHKTQDFQTIDFWIDDYVTWSEPLPVQSGFNPYYMLEKNYMGVKVKLDVWNARITLNWEGIIFPIRTSYKLAEGVMDYWQDDWKEAEESRMEKEGKDGYRPSKRK